MKFYIGAQHGERPNPTKVQFWAKDFGSEWTADIKEAMLFDRYLDALQAVLGRKVYIGSNCSLRPEGTGADWWITYGVGEVFIFTESEVVGGALDSPRFNV